MKPTSGHAQPDEELQSHATDHEHSDVNVRAILTFAGIVAAVTIGCAFIVAGMFGVFERMAAGRDPRMSPLAVPARPMPGTTASSPIFGSADGPRLVTDEPAVLRAFRQTEQAQLHDYGWTDEKTGVAHVPIEQAKKLILERGLPSRPAGVGALLGTHAPAFGEATGGRSIPTGGSRATAPTAPAGGAPATPPPLEHSAPGAGRGGA